ncbi:lanthionine synthetase LanC family protein [Mesorhizobium sp. NZP2298]|uniref:lanthionine synthetase LanC family protein n=1 Tax=Mesorhizobium sp. NZP2298 TaxID=2483403 RepID=UPI001556D52E|nr:lanthionine synthetase LanC family protein [Mesorhizobium sp. NZP2298]QKC95908.1 hypothetical protein EB231_15190 [Mesorhizobium sp. NZP2298]
MIAFRQAIEAFSLTDMHGFEWLGKRGPSLSPPTASEFNHDVVRAHAVQQIKNFLYTNFYIRGAPSHPQARPRQNSVENHQFIQKILSSDAGHNEWWDAGSVAEIRDGRVVVDSGTLKVFARPEECRSSVLPVDKGAKVQLRLGRSSLRASPGFCFLLGDADLRALDPVLRIYWNLHASAAARFVRETTSSLNAAALPFRLKVLTDPSAYDRCDSGVLYVSRTNSKEVFTEVRKIHADSGLVRSGTPAFTCRLAPGLSAADDPGNGESFGRHRCGILAESLMQAFERGLNDIDSRMRLAAEIFEGAGIDPVKPHLRAGLPELDLGPFEKQQSSRASNNGKTPSPKTNPVGTIQADWLGAAAEIGRRISAEAVWHGGRSQWIGANPLPGQGLGAVDYRTLSGGLYGGTAGIALFLAELSTRTGDSDLKRTALGAMRQALSRPGLDVGLYPGMTGIALAAARIGSLLKNDWLLDKADLLARRVLRHDVVAGQHDLIYGSAGRIVGALCLENMVKAPALKAAEKYGQALLTAAEHSSQGLSWPAQDPRGGQNLTGLSHGTAGIAYALALLWRRTEEKSFRNAAEAAIAYEQTHFNSAIANWADLRTRPEEQKPAGTRYACYWCHGAPGIALQRVWLARIFNDPTYLEHARIGMKTTAEYASRSLRHKEENYSLCHGVLGNAEVLLEWNSHTGGTDYSALALQAAAEGLRLYGTSGRWPCGTIQGDTPGLMLGRAGIGYFYLRLADPTVPSVLLVNPAAWMVERP